LERVKAFVLQANFIKLRMIKKNFLFVLPVKNAVPAYRHSGINQVVGLIKHEVVDGSSRKYTIYAKVEKR